MSTKPDPKTEKPRRQHPMLNRRKRWTIGIWVFLFNFVLAVLVVYTILSFTQAPLGLPGWVTERVEDQLNDAMPSGHIRIEALSLSVNDAGLPSIKLENLTFVDATGAETARLNGASVRLSPVDAFSGRFRPRQLDVSGAQITLRRLSDGSIAMSVGGDTSTSGSFATVLDDVEHSLDQPVLAKVDEVTASDLTITYEDALSGRVWQITDGRMRLLRADLGLDLSVLFDVFNGTEDLASVEFGLQTDKNSSAATIRARFEGAAARDIATQSPALSYLGVLNAPISGAMLTRLDEAGHVGELSGTLEIGKGALQPSAATIPLKFENARAYFTYDPGHAKISFSEVSVEGPALRATASGQAYLRDFQGDWPSTLLSQLSFSELFVNPDGLWAEPLEFQSGSAGFRVRLSPFSVEMGEVVMETGAETLLAHGSLNATEKGWSGSMDAGLDQLEVDRLVALWPTESLPKTRKWLADNISSGLFSDLNVAIRASPGETLKYELGFAFEQANIRPAPGFPIISKAGGYGQFRDQQAIFVLDEGAMVVSDGRIDMAGSYFRIPDLGGRPATAEIEISADGPASAIMSVLAAPPLRVLQRTTLQPDFLHGQARVLASVSYPMKPDRTPKDTQYSASAIIRDAASNDLIPGKELAMPIVTVRVDNSQISASGPFTIGDVRGQAEWMSAFDGSGRSSVAGDVNLSQGFVDEFNLGLPDGMVTGSGTGKFEVALAPDKAPEFTLVSDLAGLTLSVPQIGAKKPGPDVGNLSVRGTLGASPQVTDLDVSFDGLSMQDGVLTTTPEGRFDTLRFADGQIDDWFEGAVTLEGRGEGITPRILANAKTVDLTALPFSGAGSRGEGGGPLRLAADRVQVTRSISLDGVSAELDLSRGVAGRYSGQVNGGASVSGQLETVANGIAIRVTSTTGGEVIRDTGIFPSARGGDLNVTLTPLAEGGIYRGKMVMTDTRVRDAPVLTELLSALSIVGLLDQMGGTGISFSDVQADFVLRENGVEVRSSSAVGPSLGITLDGQYDANRSRLDMQGVISPVYFINSLGRVVSARDGEGLFGFNYQLTGPTNAPTVSVNPLSVLTPGFLRDIFRKQDR